MNSRSADFNRRMFLRLTGGGGVAMLAGRMPVMAGPFANEDFARLVPPDKKLDSKWVKSLFERGEPQIFRGSELEKIGMPIGGVCAGQLYLGGDGRLWHWDIFNLTPMTGSEHYANPLAPSHPFEQGFILEVGGRKRFLDKRGFTNIRFRGEYPIAKVGYRDDSLPVDVELEAFSPFIPLNTDDSSLPATIFRFTLTNHSRQAVEAKVSGLLENAVCYANRKSEGMRRNRVVKSDGLTLLVCSAEQAPDSAPDARPDILFEDWNKETYEDWTVAGEAFGKGPIPVAQTHNMGEVGGDTDRVVNSFASAIGVGADAARGTLTSREFTIERPFINVWIGGGKDVEKTAFEVVVNDNVVASTAGGDATKMSLRCIDVSRFMGRQACIRIKDESSVGWGHIGVGSITFSDRMSQGVAPLGRLPDFGTMALSLLEEPVDIASGSGVVPLQDKLMGELGRLVKIEAGESVNLTFLLTWHFPNLRIPGARSTGRSYAARFDSAGAVARYVAANIGHLSSETRLWRDTWYDGTLPYWFLDRTFSNTSILASTTCFRFKDGRLYGWEGVGCCPGTCTSVWYYAQAVARLFPELERSVREQQDFANGIGFDPESGGIFTRGEFRGDFVLDGQAGNVLRVYREHLMSVDNAFLKRNWEKTKKALGWLIAQDGDNDGIIDGKQSTTLDAGLWWGAMSWTSSLYLAALRAGVEMAREMGDRDMVKRCISIIDSGRRKLIDELWNGEYFIHKPDRSQPTSFVIGNGCHIDQVYGEAWARQVGLGRILSEKHTKSALSSVWKYNFTPDVGPFRGKFKGGRWYAMAGEAGTIMTTWPHNDRELPQQVKGGMQLGVDYLNECMSGFEHQVAGHMIGEGMVMEGLAIERAIHDRYHPSKRNPWNEIECGDHYSRAMASYGVFLEACGFSYHGPSGSMGFAPKINPEKFKAAFTAAEGWGSYEQDIERGVMRSIIAVKWGKLVLKQLKLAPAKGFRLEEVSLRLGNDLIGASVAIVGEAVVIQFESPVGIAAGESLEARVVWV